MTDKPKPVATVIILRRDPKDLTAEELAALNAKFPGRNVLLRRTDPRDYREHADICEQLKPDAVILPLDRPLPSLAMERGILHIAYVGDDFKKLRPLEPQFEEFGPGAVSSEAITKLPNQSRWIILEDCLTGDGNMLLIERYPAKETSDSGKIVRIRVITECGRDCFHIPLLELRRGVDRIQA